MLGGIDLSVQSIASLCSVILALCLPQFGYYSFFIAIVIGSLFGLISGYFHVTLKIPSFSILPFSEQFNPTPPAMHNLSNLNFFLYFLS